MGARVTSERVPKVVKELAGFKLLKELGHGGMGKVFLARQHSLDRHVALKILVPDLAADAEFVERFHREAKAAALFQHPNVVSVFDQGQDSDSGVHYIAFEYVDGGSLEDLINKKGKLTEAEALPLFRDIALALDYAESKDIVHRDVKPENILITKAGTPKLADLGLAKRSGAHNTVTQTGVVLGTPLYMAPEQALGEPDLDIRADIYALGLCLWHALTGLIPFDEDRKASSLQILAKHINHDLPDVRDRVPGVSEHTAHIITWMVARDRKQRYGSAEQVARDLDRVLAGGVPEGPKDPSSDTTVLVDAEAKTRPPRPSGRAPRASGRAPAQPPAPARMPNPTLPIVGGVLVAAFGVGIGLALALTGSKTRPDPPPPPTDTTAPPPPPAPTDAPEHGARPGGGADPTTEVSRVPPPPPTEVARASERPADHEPAPPPLAVAPPLDPMLLATEAPPAVTEAPPATERRPARTADDELAVLIEAAVRALGEAYKHDLARVPEAWRDLQARVEPLRPSLDAGAGAALERLGDMVRRFDALLRAPDAAARARAEEAIDELLAAREARPLRGRSGVLVDATIDAWVAVVDDVLRIEAMLGEVDPREREKVVRDLQGNDLKVAAGAWSLALTPIDNWTEDKKPWGRDRRGDAAARETALGVLTRASTADVEGVYVHIDEHGAPTALARVALERTGPPSRFLAARVVDVPVSSTGRPLGRARALLVVPARKLAADFELVVSIDGRSLEIGRGRIALSDRKSEDAPRWAEQPAIVVEVRRRPRIVSLDATTGAFVDSKDVDLPGRAPAFVNGAAELTYTVRSGLDRVALIQPQEAAADAPPPRRGGGFRERLRQRREERGGR